VIICCYRYALARCICFCCCIICRDLFGCIGFCCCDRLLLLLLRLIELRLPWLHRLLLLLWHSAVSAFMVASAAAAAMALASAASAFVPRRLLHLLSCAFF
jgi:hypothetical protein